MLVNSYLLVHSSNCYLTNGKEGSFDLPKWLYRGTELIGIRAPVGFGHRLVQQLSKEQRIDNFVFHDLRHCAVTNLADAGVDTETIMKIVGHSCVEMFLRYRKVKADRLDGAMQRLDSVLNTLITPPASAVV